MQDSSISPKERFDRIKALRAAAAASQKSSSGEGRELLQAPTQTLPPTVNHGTEHVSEDRGGETCADNKSQVDRMAGKDATTPDTVHVEAAGEAHGDGNDGSQEHVEPSERTPGPKTAWWRGSLSKSTLLIASYASASDTENTGGPPTPKKTLPRVHSEVRLCEAGGRSDRVERYIT
jgi:hypothetical protein